ncbi:putative dynein heavy chain [Trypanosoma rangeli]|uniref:Putative dynein heavy chain n=1 Tax=Trypanosoma rangeli TaxID=5698 RepID=A0A3R7LW91_TRYRA|nr:putative dynein heavy chain [Trypanosoma rangeli]RNF04575.1 putative dynein heavy chain [Trypanosoma rangeli]|eukprot:RNF04575.1 putative dynein heavy chain [Trypanosoma rangeli]
MAQQENTGTSCEFWWSHRRLLEEAAAVTGPPTAAVDIVASIDSVKAKAQEMMEATVTYNGDTAKGAGDAGVDPVQMGVWQAELIVLRNQLLEALLAAQQERRARCNGDALRGSVGVEPETPPLRQTVHEMLLHTVVGEWATRWASHTDADGGLASESLLDTFLDGIVFTHASNWDETGVEETAAGGAMREVVWTFLTDVWGMTPVEQEKWLPRLVQHAWEAFLIEMQRLEEEVQRVCAAAESSTAQERRDEACTLVCRAVRVLRLLAVPLTPAEVAGMRGLPRPHVVVATSAKARSVVQMIARWLPVCIGFLYSLAPLPRQQQEEDNNKQEENTAERHVDNGKKDAGDTTTSPEALEWIRRLKQQVERVFALLAQLDETSPWMMMLVDTMAHAFYATREDVSRLTGDQAKRGVGEDVETRQHMALKSFLASYERRVEVSSATAASGQWTLVEACNMKMSHVLSCALDETGRPSSLSTRVLRVLLVQRPIATLRHLLTFLCPSNHVAALCDCEAVITDKGCSSEARAMAFVEEALKENAVARTFFPKYFSVFCAVEQALVSLCADLASHEAAAVTSADAVALVLERFIAAAMDEAFTAFSELKGAAASEWLMFLAFICHETPLFEIHMLHHVRRAARRFFAPGRRMITYLHEHIVRRERHGLTAFFLPPLRAIGVDYSTCSDQEHLSCALRYPLSAEVAYFQELPRGYYCRQPLRLALNAKNDALHFFHELLMSQTAETSSRRLSAMGGTQKGEDHAMVRDLFVDMIVHIGALVAARVRGDVDRRIVTDSVAADAMSSLFFGVLRLCSSVTYWDPARRHAIQRAIAQQLCTQRPVPPPNHAGRPGMAPQGSRGNGTEEGWAPPLPMAFLLRGGCMLGDVTAQPAVAAGGVPAAAETEEEATTTTPHAWHDWFCNAEFEDVDARAGVAAMALLRVCNRNYMKFIPTRTLLERRATLEQHAAKQKESGSQAKAESAMEAAILRDVDLLRRKRDGAEVSSQTKLPEQHALVTTVVVEADGKAESGIAGNGTATEAQVKRPDVKKCEEEIQTSRNAAQRQCDTRPLPLAAVKSYVEPLVVALIQRARISVVDGVASGVALRKWLMTVSGLFEPQALLEVVRRVVLQANTKLTHATKLECASLSAFLGVVANDIVLPYKQSFFHHHHTHAKQQQRQVEPAPAEAEDNERGNGWLPRSLPASEKDAGMLLRILIADTTRAVTRFLEQATPLGDWKAYTLTLHMRRIMGLVSRYEAAFRAALTKRLQEVGKTAGTAEGIHPVQLLAAVECPLLEKMIRPAAEVDHLFTGALPPPSSLQQQQPVSFLSTSGSQRNPTIVMGGGGASGGGGGGNSNSSGIASRNGWSAPGDAHRRKRHRSRDNSYSHRHRRSKNASRDQAE